MTGPRAFGRVEPGGVGEAAQAARVSPGTVAPVAARTRVRDVFIYDDRQVDEVDLVEP
jgi:hypothetical protein